jgi:hypothetical protein
MASDSRTKQAICWKCHDAFASHLFVETLRSKSNYIKNVNNNTGYYYFQRSIKIERFGTWYRNNSLLED